MDDVTPAPDDPVAGPDRTDAPVPPPQKPDAPKPDAPKSDADPQRTPPPDGTRSRRWFLLGGGVLLLSGAGAGVAVRLARDHLAGTTTPDPPPAALVAAAARERGLIADLDATTTGDTALRAVLARTRADHVAHLAALRSLLSGYRRSDGTGSSTPAVASGTTVTLDPSSGAVASGTARTQAQLRSAETRASTAAAAAAALLDERAATLLASIAACEATHAAVLG